MVNPISRTFSLPFCFLLFIFFLQVPEARSQQIEVAGTVTDRSTGDILPGVNITIKGTLTGTASDGNGNYSIQVSSLQDTLVFSFLGYETLETPLNGRTTVDVALQPTTISGEAVVVVGYGTQQQRDLTGSIKRIDADEITRQPSLTAMESLQGKLSGVNIINSDAPGGTPSVVLRGLGTALGGRNPLYVVDGVPVSDINNISPSDIQSVDVLKDASSASIYGLRAANGVIIITTKEGQEGAPQFRVESHAGYTSILNQPEMADASQYITYFNEESAANGGFQLNTDQQYNTDWYSELLEIGRLLNNTVSVSGGGESIDYFISYNSMNEAGILEEQKFWRQTFRNNNGYRLFDEFLTIDQNLSISITKEAPKPFSAFNTAYRQSPLVPTFYPNGRYGQPFVNTTTGEVTYEGDPGDTISRLMAHGNPLTAIDFNNQERKSVTLQGAVAANFDLTSFLTFTSRVGATRYFENTENFTPNRQLWLANDPTRTSTQYQTSKETNPGVIEWVDNTLSVSELETFRWNWDNFLTLEQAFDNHDLELTIGMSSEEFGIGRRFNGTAYDVPEEQQYWNLDLASDEYTKEVNHTNFTSNTLLSYFGRVQYNYDQRYYLTATLRRDGSSKFASNEEFWELFPSAGLGWTISNEAFMSDAEFISFLKLRASWGKLGNQNVPFNTTVIFTETGSASQNYVFGPDQTLRLGASAGSPARDISWEIVEEWNVGLDLEVLESRLSTTLDLYRKSTNNVILLVTPTPSSPFSEDYYDHGGEVINEGLEVEVNWSNTITDDFFYTIGTNFSYNENVIRSVVPGYEGLTGGSLGNGEITKRLAEAQPIGAWWLYEAEGVWQSQAQIDANPSVGGAAPGHLRYSDLNEDGIIDERDKRYFGSYLPVYTYGVNLDINYRQFDFSIDGFGSGGNKVYNGLKNTRIGGENITEEMFENRWTGSGNTHPGANRDQIASSYYLEDGDYFRINNITLGYTLSDIIDHVTGVRLYISAQNPFLFTGYSGFTPELIGGGNGDPFNTAGIELSAYPNTRTLLFGIDINLQ